jgi:VanZ family protein
LLSFSRNWSQLMMLLKTLRTPWLWKVALVCYWLTLFVSTHLPTEVLYVPANSSDKFLHVAAYAMLAALLGITWHLAAGPFTLRRFGLAWLALVIYGAIDEWTQVPVGRDASVGDWLCDGLGATIGLASVAMLIRVSRALHSTDD